MTAVLSRLRDLVSRLRRCGPNNDVLVLLMLRMVVWQKRIRESKCASDLSDIVEEMRYYIRAAFKG